MTVINFEKAKQIENDYQYLIGTEMGSGLIYKLIIALPIDISINIIAGMVGKEEKIPVFELTDINKNDSACIYVIIEQDGYIYTPYDLVDVFKDLFQDFSQKYPLTSRSL